MTLKTCGRPRGKNCPKSRPCVGSSTSSRYIGLDLLQNLHPRGWAYLTMIGLFTCGNFQQPRGIYCPLPYLSIQFPHINHKFIFPRQPDTPTLPTPTAVEIQQSKCRQPLLLTMSVILRQHAKIRCSHCRTMSYAFSIPSASAPSKFVIPCLATRCHAVVPGSNIAGKPKCPFVIENHCVIRFTLLSDCFTVFVLSGLAAAWSGMWPDGVCRQRVERGGLK